VSERKQGPYFPVVQSVSSQRLKAIDISQTNSRDSRMSKTELLEKYLSCDWIIWCDVISWWRKQRRSPKVWALTPNWCSRSTEN